MNGVLMLVNEFPPLPVGGAERQAERLAEFMGHQGLWAGVITRGFDGLPETEIRDGFDVIRIPQYGTGKLKALTFVIKAVLAIFQRRRSFDVLHAHLEFSAAVAAAIAGTILRKPVIVKFGSSGASSEVRNAKGPCGVG